MSDTAAASAPSPAKKVIKAKNSEVAPAHPPVATMVSAAIAGLKDHKGSSLSAIKKHIDVNNKNVNSAKLAPFIKRYLKSAVATGKLVQTKGTGAAGSFKLEKEENPKKEVKKAPLKEVKKAVLKKIKKPKAAIKKPATKNVKPPKKTAENVKTPTKPAKKPKSPKKVVKKPAAKKAHATPKAKRPAAKKAPAKK